MIESGRRHVMSAAEILNAQSDPEAAVALQKCCAAPEWVSRMTKRRPFENDVAVARAAAKIWWSLAREQWLQAFAAHPKIGDVGSLRAKFANAAAWAAGEQAG